MDISEELTLYKQVENATNELLSVAERHEENEGPDAEHVLRRIPAMLDPILDMLSRASDTSILLITVGRVPENKVASHMSAFGHFRKWITSAAATRTAAMLAGVFEVCWRKQAPSTLPPARKVDMADLFPPVTWEFLSQVSSTHADLLKLLQLIAEYKLLCPPVGEYGVFGRMSSAEVPPNPHIPRRGTTEVAPWLTADLPLGFYNMDPADHHLVNSGAFCQWTKGDLFMDKSSGLHLGGVDGIRWAAFALTRITHHVQLRVRQRGKQPMIRGALDLNSIQVYTDAAIQVCVRQLTASIHKLSSEREGTITKPTFVTLSAVPSPLDDLLIEGLHPPSGQTSAVSSGAQEATLTDSDDDDLTSPARSSQPLIQVDVPAAGASSITSRIHDTSFQEASRKANVYGGRAAGIVFFCASLTRNVDHTKDFSLGGFKFPISQKHAPTSAAAPSSSAPAVSTISAGKSTAVATPAPAAAEPAPAGRPKRGTLPKIKEEVVVKLEKVAPVQPDRVTRGKKRKQQSQDTVKKIDPQVNFISRLLSPRLTFFLTMDISEELTLYKQVENATNELLSVAERHEENEGSDAEHVLRRIPAMLDPILDMLSRASDTSIPLITVGRVPKNKVASHMSAFGHFCKWITSAAATRTAAMLAGVFEVCWRKQAPSTLPPARKVDMADLFPPVAWEFLSQVSSTHADLLKLLQLIAEYELLCPPVGEYGVFGRMSSAEVPPNPHIPR
ncbi:hypothetical protein BDV93DRAFT_516782, partial [Ceratobasidium sp. AG-I]